MKEKLTIQVPIIQLREIIKKKRMIK